MQRVANRLLAEDLPERLDNSAHRRAPLLAATQAGRNAVSRTAPEQTAFSERIVKAFGRAELESLISELHRLSTVVADVLRIAAIGSQAPYGLTQPRRLATRLESDSL